MFRAIPYRSRVIVISDTSVLSHLAELGEVDLLRRLYGRITIPTVVQNEALHPLAPKSLRLFMESAPEWLVIWDEQIPLLEETRVLDPGEAAAISLAWRDRKSSLLILDEKRGRRVSAALGLQFTGTAGILADAASLGWVEFDDIFGRLAKTGFYLAPSILGALREHQTDRPGSSRK